MKNLLRAIHESGHGRVGTALQTALYLLLTAGLVFVLMTATACDCNDDGMDDCSGMVVDWAKYQQWSANRAKQLDESPDFKAKITDEDQEAAGRALPGERVHHSLGGQIVDSPAPTVVTYTWSPPPGASNFSFPGRQPEPGGPPFVFLDVPPTEIIPVEFDLPAAGPYGGSRLPETLAGVPDSGRPTTAYYVTSLLGETAAPSSSPAPALPGAAPAGAKDMVEMWGIRNWFGAEIAVSSEECQQAVDLLQSDAAFLVLRLPEPPHAVTESALLPIYDNPAVELIDYAGGLNVQAEAGLQPDRQAFAENALPPAPGKTWATLGVSAQPAIVCPAGQETDDWELFTALQLDLSFAPDGCEGCILDVFLCYEGQVLPGGGLQRYIAGQQIDRALEQLVLSATAGEAGVQSYQDWGITCAGPLPMQLIDNPDWTEWSVGHASAQWVTPTMPITLPHVLDGEVDNPPQLVDLEFSSSLDAGWSWSDGTQPIVPPVSFAGGYPPTNIFLVGTVPAGTPAGLYTMQVTATLVSSPADSRFSSDIVWVGDWVPPPPGQVRYRVYLPVTVKAF